MSIQKVTKTVEQQVEEIISITCDKCLKVVNYPEDVNDHSEWEGFVHINFTGGYGSIFGDMSTVSANICQHCMEEFFLTFPNGIPFTQRGMDLFFGHIEENNADEKTDQAK